MFIRSTRATHSSAISLKNRLRLLIVVVCIMGIYVETIPAQRAGETSPKQALKPRVTSPHLHWTAQNLITFDPAWIHVKFVEDTDVNLQVLPSGEKTFAGIDLNKLSEVNELLAGAVEAVRTFPGDRGKFKAWKTRGEAATGTAGPDLSLWFNIKMKGDRQSLADTINALNAAEAIEIAHPAPVCEPAAIVNIPLISTLGFLPLGGAGTPDFSASQDYLYDTPVGLDAPSAWEKTGGRGANMKFIDVELGWTHNHEDFNMDNLFHQGANDSTDPTFHNHGTAVLGEVVGADNGFGITGFASDAQWGTVGITLNEYPFVPNYFLEAAESMEPGDVWLIELQMFPSGLDATPMEYIQVNFDAIWTSSFALGVVCVEAGANGSQNLDSPVFNGMFDREVRDSGAILVAAGTPTGRVAEFFTNYGSRIDVHAWGSQIVTTGYGDLQNQGPFITQYTAGFGGTSGASPMIVGSALCLQGIKKALSGTPFTPLELRGLLNETGIDHLDQNMEIGPRPDLAAAVAEIFSEILFGDVNHDTRIDLLDVDPFVESLSKGTYIVEADINCDGSVDLADVALFVSLLSQ